jgi:hypothetical protein
MQRIACDFLREACDLNCDGKLLTNRSPVPPTALHHGTDATAALGVEVAAYSQPAHSSAHETVRWGVQGAGPFRGCRRPPVLQLGSDQVSAVRAARRHVAAQHNADWLQVYLANPFLPGFNPSHLKPGYNLRLGTHIRNVTLVNATPPLPDLEGMPPARVQIRAVHARSYARVYTGVLYNARWGEDLDRLSQRFFVPQSALLAQNPELAAPTSVAYSPDAPGANTQVSRGVETEGTQCVCAF